VTTPEAQVPSRAVSERLIEYSRDQDAFREYRELFFRAKGLPFWRRRERRKLEARAEAAWERAVAAGIDLSTVPTPPATLRVPDRSGRRPIGGGAPANRLAAQAEDQADSGGTMFSGGGGMLGGLALLSLLNGTPALAGSTPGEGEGGGVWKEHDGDLYYTDAQGDVFQRGEDGSFQAVGDDGLLWSQGADGAMFATDGSGNTWSMNDQGDLFGVDANGQEWLLGDDGNAYGVGSDGDVAADPGSAGFDDGGADLGADDGGGFDLDF
jgi:hypothetical protein